MLNGYRKAGLRNMVLTTEQADRLRKRRATLGLRWLAGLFCWAVWAAIYMAWATYG